MTPGRNDPCPCGSGAKFKRCACGAYEATQFPTRKASDAKRAKERAALAALRPDQRAALARQAQRRVTTVLGLVAALSVGQRP